MHTPFNSKMTDLQGSPGSGSDWQNPLLEAFFRLSSDAIEVADSTGRITYVNPAFEKITGYTAADIVDKKTSDIFDQLDMETIDQGIIWQTIITGEVWRGQLSTFKRDGSLWISDATLTPLYNDIDQTTHYIVLKRDITEQSQREQEFLENHKRFQIFAEIGSDWFWEMDSKLHFTFISRRFFEITGISHRLFIGKTFFDYNFGRAKSNAHRRLQDDLEAHRPFRNFGFPITSPHGREIYLSLSGNPIHDDNGEFAGFRGNRGKTPGIQAISMHRCLTMSGR